jgi:hypothetical protein
VACAGAALLLGLIFALPKESGEVSSAIGRFGEVEERCLDALNTAVQRVESGAMEDREFARILGEEILPVWEASLKEFEQLDRIPDELADQVNRIRRYGRARQEGWSLLVRAIRENNPELAAQAHEKQRQADRLVSEIQGEDAAD